MKFINKLVNIALPLSVLAGLLAMPVQAHHSFAMYDMRKCKAFHWCGYSCRPPLQIIWQFSLRQWK